MRALYQIMERLAGTKNVVSFHYKSFPTKPFYLTIHDLESNCHMYQADTLEGLEAEINRDLNLILGSGVVVANKLPLPPGFPKP